MKKINYKIKAALIIAMIGMTMLAWAVKHHATKKPATAIKKVAREAKQPEIVYDPGLVNKFESLGQQLDFNRAHCTYAGIINMVDNKDTTNTVKGINFLFCRAEKNFYYRVGNAETIYQEGVDIFIQHEQKKVVLSNREIAIKAPVTGSQEIQSKLRNESYELVSKSRGDKKTLSIVNDHHISCKELSVTYDTLSNKLERIYTRLSDFGDPLNKNNDREIEVLISRIDYKGDMDLYPSAADVLKKTGGKWKLTSKYADYELIIL
jgi:hypothetical protein